MDKYKNLTIKGYHFPDDKILTNLRGQINESMRTHYLPCLEKINTSKGVKLLVTIMAQIEGFFAPSKTYPNGSRSFRTNNPGNIGNTDNGSNNGFKTLQDGIMAQIEYVNKVAENKHGAYKFGRKIIKPYYSSEIANNPKTYGGKSPYLPGYDFDFSGQLGGFVKIYSTGARAGNRYLSVIISYFAEHEIIISENTTLKEIININ